LPFTSFLVILKIATHVMLRFTQHDMGAEVVCQISFFNILHPHLTHISLNTARMSNMGFLREFLSYSKHTVLRETMVQ